MDEPLLTIITINLNNSAGLRQTIQSVVDQSFSNYEFIVIDGDSNDGSVAVIKEYCQKIKFWSSEPDNGIYSAMNKGILKSSGKYIQFLNSGDWLTDSSVLSRVFQQVRDEDILYGNYYIINTDKRKLVTFQNIKMGIQFLYNSSIGHSATFIKRVLFNGDLYDENLKIVSDWKFFLKKIVIESCTLHFIDIPISYFNVMGISNSVEMQSLMKLERINVINEYFSPWIINEIEELIYIKSLKPVRHILEIQQYKGFRVAIAGFIRFSLIIYQGVLKFFGYKTAPRLSSPN